MIDPNNYVITRRRKLYKFALFANNQLCFEMDEWKKIRSDIGLQGDSLQTVDVVEVGAGTGLFSVELASRHPELIYVAVDVKADRLQNGAAEAVKRGLTNIWFVRARADQLGQLFAPDSVSQLWLTFPDPFPRKRSAGRRLTHKTFLSTYTNMLSTDGSLYLKHDNPDFFNWSLMQMVAYGWYIDELSLNLHESDLPDDYRIKTTYEDRWLSEGRNTRFVRMSHGE